MAHTRKPTMAITMGDPAGIGPEITLKTIQDERIHDICDPFVIGSADSLERAAEIQGVRDLKLNVITEPEQARNEFGTVDLLETGVEPDATIGFGAIQVAAARRAYSYIEKSIELGMAGRIDGVSTAPINKAALKAAEVPYIGHTEIYQALTGSPYALTMFNVHRLRVFFVSRHVSLREACDLANHDRILEFLGNIDTELKKFGFEHPSIGVAALNPPSRTPRPSASTRTARTRPTRSSPSTWTGTTTASCRCTTTRATSPARRWTSRTPSR